MKRPKIESQRINGELIKTETLIKNYSDEQDKYIDFLEQCLPNQSLDGL